MKNNLIKHFFMQISSKYICMFINHISIFISVVYLANQLQVESFSTLLKIFLIIQISWVIGSWGLDYYGIEKLSNANKQTKFKFHVDRISTSLILSLIFI